MKKREEKEEEQSLEELLEEDGLFCDDDDDAAPGCGPTLLVSSLYIIIYIFLFFGDVVWAKLPYSHTLFILHTQQLQQLQHTHSYSRF